MENLLSLTSYLYARSIRDTTPNCYRKGVLLPIIAMDFDVGIDRDDESVIRS